MTRLNSHKITSSLRISEGHNTRKSSRAPSIQAKPHPGTDMVNEIFVTEAEDLTEEIILPKADNITFTSLASNAISIEAHSCKITPSHVRQKSNR